MDKLDLRSIIFGVILSVLVTGLYDTVFYLALGKTTEEWGSMIASIGTVIFLWVFWKYLSGRLGTPVEPQQVNKREEEVRKQPEQPEETESEKLKREFQNREL